MCQTCAFSLFMGFLAIRVCGYFVRVCGKMFLGGRRFPPEVSGLFIGFHPILHRLQKCISICCGFLSRAAFRYTAALPLVI